MKLSECRVGMKVWVANPNDATQDMEGVIVEVDRAERDIGVRMPGKRRLWWYFSEDLEPALSAAEGEPPCLR